MALGPRSRQRLKQLESWLCVEFPIRAKVCVLLVPKVPAEREDPADVRRYGYFGESYVGSRSLVIRISTSKNRTYYQAAETLMHEWAHLRALRESLRRPHGPRWRAQFGAIYEAYNDRGGWEHCR